MANPIDQLKSGAPCVVIGKLETRVISALNLRRSECDIVMWADRLTYIEKHRPQFVGDFDRQISMIPEIIASPDYVCARPGNDSIEYIKRINDLVLVAIRLKTSGPLALRSVYPITETQLKAYLLYGSAKPV